MRPQTLDSFAPTISGSPPGRPAELRFQRVGDRTVLSHCYSTSPLKLLAPRTHSTTAWAYASSYGGGLLAGDHVRLSLTAEAHTRCFVGTQSATKVYRSPDGTRSVQELGATVDDGALLVWAPDPVCCFAEASYDQRQKFTLSPAASLVLVDALTSGRHARGERYAFSRYRSRYDVLIGAEHVLADSLLLDHSHRSPAAAHRMGRFNCLATLVMIGPMLDVMAKQILDEVAELPLERKASLIQSASPLGNGMIVRVLGTETEGVTALLHRYLMPLTELLGDDPWRRKW